MDPNNLPDIKVPSEVGWGTFAAGVGFIFAWLGKLELSSRSQKAILKRIEEKIDGQKAHLNLQDERSSKWRRDFNIALNVVGQKVTGVQTSVAVLEAVREDRDRHPRGEA